MTSQTLSQNNEVKELKDQVSDLSCLIRINAMLNSTLDLSELLQNIMGISEEVMSAEASSLMLIDESTNELVFEISRGEKGAQVKELFRLKMGQGIAGWVAENNEPVLIPDVTKDPRFFSKADKKTGFVTRSMVCVPLLVKNKVIGIIQVLNPKGKDGFDENDKKLLIAFSDSAAVAIENARMVKSLIETQRMEQELTIAKQIQENFLLNSFPAIRGGGVFAKNITAREIGGDFYDFVKLDKNRLAIFIGDVSGKGIPAALYMIKIITDFRSLIASEEDPAVILCELNSRLHRESTMGMFATVLLGIYDISGKNFTFVNAGHHDPLYMDSANTVTEIKSNSHHPPVGVLEDMTYNYTVQSILPGEKLLLYTDGVIEARNRLKNEYSIERLMSKFKQTDGTAKKMVNTILRDIMNYSQHAIQHDDITLIALKAGKV